MKSRDEIAIGDPVEVRFAMKPDFLAEQHKRYPEQPVAAVSWRPGTVCHLTDSEIGVAFGNSTRMSIVRRSNTWRPA